MTIDIDYVIGGVVLAFLGGLLLGAGVVGLLTRRRHREVATPLTEMLAPRVEDQSTKAYVDSVPRFGRPEVVIYRRAEWEEDLRCNGERCSAPELKEGQAIWLVPIPSGHLPLCLDCTPAPITVHP